MQRLLRPIAVFLPLALAAACSSTTTEAVTESADTTANDPGKTTPLSNEPARVVYQVLVRSFWDGSPTPDGTGDLRGVTAKLDYLVDLGVDALLLMPVYASNDPLGYIATDLYSVDPAYGTKDDLAALVGAAHARNIKVVLDSPVNHLGDNSPWFQRARQKDCAGNASVSPYCRYFFFTPDPATTAPFENWHTPWDWDRSTTAAVFQKAWQFDASRDRDEQYYATFSPQMPDLAYWSFDTNDWNTPVVEEMNHFFATWAGMGIDGFRIDAAKHIVEGAASNAPPSTPHNLELLRGFLANVRKTRAGTSFIAEVYSGADEIETYLPDATDMVLDFPWMYAVRDGLSWDGNNADPLRQVLAHYEATQDRFARGHRLIFSGNHDVPRLWTQLGGNLDKVRMAHFVTMLGPDSPSLFYGEEVGMEGTVVRADPHANPPILADKVDTVRAFPWDGDSPSVGFPVAPGQEAPTNYATNNLEAMKRNPNSLFNFVKNTIALRKTFPITAQTKLHVSTSLFGAMMGYTLVTPADGGGAPRCRTVVVNMSMGGPWAIPVTHNAPECVGAREAYRDAATPGDAGTYAMGPYGKVVIDTP